MLPEATIITLKCASTKKLFGMRTQRFGNQWIATWAFKLSDETAKSEKYDTVGVGIVDTVIDSDEPNAHFGEIDFCVKAGFDVIASDAAQILYNHRFHNPVFNIRNQLLPAGTVKVAAAVAVIRVVTAADEALFPGVVLKKGFLIGDGVRFAAQLIVARQALIKSSCVAGLLVVRILCCSFCLLHGCEHVHDDDSFLCA